MMAQFSREVSDDDGDGNRTGDGGGAKKEAERTEGAIVDLAWGSAEAVGVGADGRDGPDP